MTGTLKSKFTWIYLFLVVLIAVVGSASIIKLLSLSNTLEGLMTNNYKSINAVANMLSALDMQDAAMLTYINLDNQKGINQFTENYNLFLKWLNIESSNITEAGESSYVENINKSYLQYIKSFSELQEIKNEVGLKESISLYDSKIIPTFSRLKNDLKSIALINENAMFKSKNRAIQNTKKSIYLVLLISVVAIIGGFALSRYFVNKLLMPLNTLTQRIRLVREGDLRQEAVVFSKDEIGELAVEFNNMTQRLQSYEQSSLGKLMNEKNKSMAIVKSISDPLIVMDTNFKIILINHACENFFNVQEEEAVNKHFLEVLRDGEIFDYISDAFYSKEDLEGKIISIKSNTNGRNLFFNVIVTKVMNIKSQLTSLVVTFHNVTQFKELELTKTDFISTISHEFKTPLTSVIMGTGLLSDENLGPLNSKQEKVLSTIKEDSERLSVLVNDLLELSKLESGKSVFNMKPCLLSKIIDNCVKSLLESAHYKNINLFYDDSEILPEVNADFEKITWVLNNLITNALKYTDSGDEIRISAKINNGMIFISISDTGIGIPQEYLGKIFDKYFQVKGKDIEVRGTGLGLAIVKEIVEVHGGKIWCESELESGSVFTFTLPLY
ncbi:MAG: ATP-binding protein [Bacillota bacterium]|nr:ATP-binding protein [Bacillota bacterium]